MLVQRWINECLVPTQHDHQRWCGRVLARALRTALLILCCTTAVGAQMAISRPGLCSASEGSAVGEYYLDKFTGRVMSGPFTYVEEPGMVVVATVTSVSSPLRIQEARRTYSTISLTVDEYVAGSGPDRFDVYSPSYIESRDGRYLYKPSPGGYELVAPGTKILIAVNRFPMRGHPAWARQLDDIWQALGYFWVVSVDDGSPMEPARAHLPAGLELDALARASSDAAWVVETSSTIVHDASGITLSEAKEELRTQYESRLGEWLGAQSWLRREGDSDAGKSKQ